VRQPFKQQAWSQHQIWKPEAEPNLQDAGVEVERIRREKERERDERVKSAKEDAIKRALKMKKRVLQVDAAVSMSLDHATAEARKIAAAKHEMESQSESFCRAISLFFCDRVRNHVLLTRAKRPTIFFAVYDATALGGSQMKVQIAAAKSRLEGQTRLGPGVEAARKEAGEKKEAERQAERSMADKKMETFLGNVSRAGERGGYSKQLGLGTVPCQIPPTIPPETS
jgi:hypothetical protein